MSQRYAGSPADRQDRREQDRSREQQREDDLERQPQRQELDHGPDRHGVAADRAAAAP